MQGFVRAKSPLRISFAGGGTDFPEWFEERGGAVLSGTINLYATASAAPRDDGQVRITSLDLDRSVAYAVAEEPVYDGVLDLVKAVVARMGVNEGIDIAVHS